MGPHEAKEHVITLTGITHDMDLTPRFSAEPGSRADYLRKAEESVCGKRAQDYGEPEDNFAMIANLWSEYLKTDVTPSDVAMMMILLKVARVKCGGGSGDCFVDIAGYAACGGEIAEREAACE